MMPDVSFGGLAIVSAVAFAVPLLLGLFPRVRLPSAVLELVAGIVIGPAGLGWVRPDLPIQVLAIIGLAFLLFLAGLEIDLRALRGRLLRLAGGGFAVARAGRSMRLSDALVRLQDTTAQIRVRGAVALLVASVALAERFGLESILGAFIAGAILSLLDRDAMMTHPQFRVKLEAIGFGFLIPIFFISSGLRFDLHALFASAST